MSAVRNYRDFLKRVGLGLGVASTVFLGAALLVMGLYLDWRRWEIATRPLDYSPLWFYAGMLLALLVFVVSVSAVGRLVDRVIFGRRGR